ncbi:Small heat shock protein Ibp [Buchnera aphidicola (Takecallis arundicolens)]|uniref:Hsp20 family protein n=1 Tax=Buchnera aphidicola TaxID=9 RepID=UPI003464D175
MPYNSISFTPILSNSLFSNRFNQIDKIFSTLTGEKPLSNIPDYDIIKCNDRKYLFVLTVPGYLENELNISIENNQLKISGTKQKKENQQNKNIQYIHKGIKNNNFDIQFNLQHPIKINQATLETGLLKIKFEYEVPESQKIKRIHIQKI